MSRAAASSIKLKARATKRSVVSKAISIAHSKRPEGVRLSRSRWLSGGSSSSLLLAAGIDTRVVVLHYGKRE